VELSHELVVPLDLRLREDSFSVFTVIASANLPHLRVTCMSKAKCLRVYVAQNFHFFTRKQGITLRTAFALSSSHVVFYIYIEVSRVSLSSAVVSVTYCFVILQYVR